MFKNKGGERMEETERNEPKIRWNIKQSAKGNLYWEFTVRGETNEECKRLAEEAKTELEKICRPETYE